MKCALSGTLTLMFVLMYYSVFLLHLSDKANNGTRLQANDLPGYTVEIIFGYITLAITLITQLLNGGS